MDADIRQLSPFTYGAGHKGRSAGRISAPHLGGCFSPAVWNRSARVTTRQSFNLRSATMVKTHSGIDGCDPFFPTPRGTGFTAELRLILSVVLVSLASAAAAASQLTGALG